MAIEEIGVRTVVQNLGGFLSGMDRYNRALDKAGTKTQQFSEKAQRAGVALGAISAPVIALGFLATRTFADFEQSMAKVEAVTGATAEEFADLEALARRMGETTVFTARQAAEALGFMAMAGQTAAQQISSLPSVLRLAAGGQLDLGASADIITNILAGQQLQVEELAAATDVMVQAFTSSNVSLVQLGTAFKFAGPVATTAGIAFEEQAAILGLLGNAGIQASLAGTSLRGAIARLLSPSKAAQKVLDRLGVQALDAGGNLKSFSDIVDQLAAGGATATDIIDIFGLRASAGMARLLAIGGDALRDFVRELENAGGRAEAVERIQLDTLRGGLTLTASAAEGAAISIGEALAPAVGALAAALKPVLNQVGELAARFPTVTTVVFAGAVALGGLALALVGIGFILPGVIAGLSILVAVIGALVAVASPVLLILAALASLVVAAIIIWKKWSVIVDAVVATFKKMVDILRKPLNLFSLIPGVPSFGTGGIQTSSGAAIVGERGPELVHLPGGSQVAPISRSTTNNFTANYSDRREPQSFLLDAEAVAMMTRA
jgi:TP901 family phage tail tape measure protein